MQLNSLSLSLSLYLYLSQIHTHTLSLCQGSRGQGQGSHTYDDLHSGVDVGVVGQVGRLVGGALGLGALAEHGGVEVVPLLHQLPDGRLAHLVRLTRQRATQPVRAQDHCTGGEREERHMS